MQRRDFLAAVASVSPLLVVSRSLGLDAVPNASKALPPEAALLAAPGGIFTLVVMPDTQLHLEVNPPDDVLEWANTLLEKHTDRLAVVTTHHYLGHARGIQRPERFDAPTGRMDWSIGRGNTPQQMWDKCFRKHKNVFLILCGCRGSNQAIRETSTGMHGNIVHEVMADYTWARRASAGEETVDDFTRELPLRLMRFVPADDRIEVRTYSPVCGVLVEKTAVRHEGRHHHQFVLDYPFRSRRT